MRDRIAVIKIDHKALLCACDNDALVTVDGSVAIRDPENPYMYRRIVCPQPPLREC